MTRRRRRQQVWSPPLGPPSWFMAPTRRRRRRASTLPTWRQWILFAEFGLAGLAFIFAEAGLIGHTIALLAAMLALALITTARGRAIVRWALASRRRRAYVERRRREQVPPGLRFRVFQRDGFRCTYCGRTAAASELQADHVVPVALGGGTELENLVTACGTCNLGKSAIPVV